MPASRARALVGVAEAIATGTVDLSPSADRSVAASAMEAIKGIGPWTASVVLLKATADPDAFGANDLILQRIADEIGLPGDTRSLEAHAERWRPWRAYAMHHLWAEYLARSEPIIDEQEEPA
jgi:AraC family transcriptional regulator of adaptative response / DNA-3-methyladenine glycosylase II